MKLISIKTKLKILNSVITQMNFFKILMKKRNKIQNNEISNLIKNLK